jgi:hypothetical protein
MTRPTSLQLLTLALSTGKGPLIYYELRNSNAQHKGLEGIQPGLDNIVILFYSINPAQNMLIA